MYKDYIVTFSIKQQVMKLTMRILTNESVYKF